MSIIPYTLFNHQTSSLSELDLAMIRHVPAGGNWKDIPEHIPSKRLEQIRRTGGRTTYYGRLRWDKPAYTINTYFNRPGNGTFMHPDDGRDNRPAQHRLISFREAARLQTFPDNYRFWGPKTSLLNQIGNAVPPLLAYAVARNVEGESAAELFAGAGGLSLGFELAGFSVLTALDIDKHAITTYAAHHPNTHVIRGDILDGSVQENFIESTIDRLFNNELDVLIGGPPCQGFSTAGWRKSDDPRNKLWQGYMHILEALRPKWFVLENVPGMKSMRTKTAGEKGRLVIDIMVEEFTRLGYRVVMDVLNAIDYGVPQRRRRLFLVGVRHDIPTPPRLPAPVVEHPLTVHDAISNLPPLGANDGQEVTLLEDLPAQSLLQQWLQGELSIEQFYGSLEQLNAAPAHQLPLF